MNIYNTWIVVSDIIFPIMNFRPDSRVVVTMHRKGEPLDICGESEEDDHEDHSKQTMSELDLEGTGTNFLPVLTLAPFNMYVHRCCGFGFLTWPTAGEPCYCICSRAMYGLRP